MTKPQPISFPAEDDETAILRLREALTFLRNYISGYCVIVQPKRTLSGITPEENILATIDKALAGYEALKPAGDLLPALRMYQREEISVGRLLEIIGTWRRGEDYTLPDSPDDQTVGDMSNDDDRYVLDLSHCSGPAIETFDGFLALVRHGAKFIDIRVRKDSKEYEFQADILKCMRKEQPARTHQKER